MGPAEPDRPVYSALGSAALGRWQNSPAGQKSRAGDPCVSSAGNLPVCGQQRFVGKLECNDAISAHRNLRLLDLSNSPASASQVVGTTGAHHRAQLIFVFLVETGFHHVDQDGLDLLTSITCPFQLTTIIPQKQSTTVNSGFSESV
ncbi:hypothetical protein AAY473_030478 [Plecturocebus cupreus]